MTLTIVGFHDRAGHRKAARELDDPTIWPERR